MTRALSLLLLVFGGLSVLAQTVTDIDTRGKPGAGPMGRVLASSCRLDSDNAALKAVFVIDDPSTLKAGDRFDYELVLTNQGTNPVVIPEALNWEDVQAGDSESYLWASVDIRVDPGDGLEASLPNGLKLYGTKDKHWSEVALAPGDSVRILGSVTLPISMNINTKRVGKATLKGGFHLGTMWVHRTPTVEDPDAYRTESRWLFSAVARERYPVDLEMEP
jgi:hypothetical protein